MNRFLIDLSNVLGVMSHRGEDPDAFEAESGDIVRTWEYSYSQFLTAYKEALTITKTTPRQTIAVLDAQGSRRMRQRIHPEYKNHRVPKSHEYYSEFETLKTQVLLFLKELGATSVYGKGYEADDVIVQLGRKIPDCVVWSTDKDLSIPEVLIYKNGEMSAENPYLPGLDRKFIPLYRTLVGDSKDFGPRTSCKGFGEKAFKALIQNNSDEALENLCNFISEGKANECGIKKIEDSALMVETTWKLANWFPISYYRLKWDVSYAHTTSCLTFDDDFSEFYQQIELITEDKFTPTLKEKVQKESKEAPFISLDIETSVGEDSEDWLADIKENFSRSPITVDAQGSKLAGLSITVGSNLQKTYYFPVDHAETKNIKSLDLRDFILGLENDFVAHNAGGFELPVLKNNWDKWLPNCHCSMIAAGYVDENRRKSLKYLSETILSYKQTSYKEVTQGRRMNELTGVEVLQYGCDDTITAGFQMNHWLTVMQLEGSLQAYMTVEQDAMYLVASAFSEGVDVRLETLEELEKPDKEAYEKNYQILTDYLLETGHKSTKIPQLSAFKAKDIKEAYKIFYRKPFKCQMRIIEKVLDALPDCDFKVELKNAYAADDLSHVNTWLKEHWEPYSIFKVNSPTEVPDLLYRHMKCPVMFRKFTTKTQRAKGIFEGNPKGDSDAVKWAIKYNCTIAEVKALEALTRCKSYLTRKGLYYDPYKWLVHWSDGKLRPNLKQSNTSSRRFAPSGSNVNQLPKRDEEGKKIRQCVIPHHEDAVLISPDFSGQELRHSADATKDPNFLSCYIGENLKDLHTLTAFEICMEQGKEFESYEEMMKALADKHHPKYKLAKDYRGNKAKATNFLSQYISLGGGVGTLSEKLQISPEVAQKFLNAKAKAFPGVDIWKASYTELCRKTQMAHTRLGAVKHLHDAMIRTNANAVLRSAVNFYIQSSSAEQTKLVMGSVWKARLLEKYDAKFYFPVHDEILFSIAKKDLTAFCKELQPLMEAQYADMIVPCKSSLAVGFNFGQLDEIEWDKTDEWLFDQQVS